MTGSLGKVASVVGIAAFLLGTLACSDTATSPSVNSDAGMADAALESEGGSAPRSGCSTGEPYPPYDTRFPYVAGDYPPGAPFCLPRCAYDQGARPTLDTDRYYVDAVPSGACSVEAERCFMPVQVVCACGVFGPRSTLRCDCVNGLWSCAVTGDPSSTVCPC